jgi:hypothetical protein
VCDSKSISDFSYALDILDQYDYVGVHGIRPFQTNNEAKKIVSSLAWKRK